MDVITRDEFEDLLGAFALDVCDSDELVAVERYIAAHPEVIAEVERLRAAAAGLAASDALAPPRDLRTAVFERARARRVPRTQTPHRSARRGRGDARRATRRGARLRTRFPTLNGLTIRELVAHLAAMESVLAMWMGVPTVPRDRRRADRGAHGRSRRADARLAVRRRDRALAALDGCGSRRGARSTTSRWFSSEMPTDLVLLVRAFETWTHTDDIRRSLGRALDVAVGVRAADDGRRFDDHGAVGAGEERALATAAAVRGSC